MKKIFTLIFSLGMLTAAFAQEGGRHQRDYNVGSQNQSYGYKDHKDQTYQANPYSNHDNWGNNRGNESQRYDSRDDMRRWRDVREYNDNTFSKERYNHRAKHLRRQSIRLSFRFGKR